MSGFGNLTSKLTHVKTEARAAKEELEGLENVTASRTLKKYLDFEGVQSSVPTDFAAGLGIIEKFLELERIYHARGATPEARYDASTGQQKLIDYFQRFFGDNLKSLARELQKVRDALARQNSAKTTGTVSPSGGTSSASYATSPFIIQLAGGLK